MRKRKKGSDPENKWMDTYGDMVTLLLCFFVLLYSISTVDQSKWIQLVKSFNPDAKEVSQIVTTENTVDGSEEVPGDLGAATTETVFDDLYEKLKEAVEGEGLSAEVELYKGDGYTFVTFRDNVFFDGDSSVIKEEGRHLLDRFASVLSDARDSIREIQILGHTTQATADHQNSVEFDRVLSSERAARVAAYIQEKGLVEPQKLVSVGYGQFRPIAPFDTEENRAKNRRVEMIITKSDSVTQSLEEYYKEMNK